LRLQVLELFGCDIVDYAFHVAPIIGDYDSHYRPFTTGTRFTRIIRPPPMPYQIITITNPFLLGA
jgi:hypothetical protein